MLTQLHTPSARQKHAEVLYSMHKAGGGHADAGMLGENAMRQFFSSAGFVAAIIAVLVLNYFLLGRGWDLGELLLSYMPIGFVLGHMIGGEDARRQTTRRPSWVWKLIIGVLLLATPLCVLFYPPLAAQPGRLPLAIYTVQYIFGLAFLLNLLLFWRINRQQRRVKETTE